MILICFSSAYTINQIEKYGLEIFHSSKNPESLFSEVWVINLLSFSQSKRDEPPLFFNYRFFSQGFHMIELSGNGIGGFGKLVTLPRQILNAIKQNSSQDSLWSFLRSVKLIRSEDPLINGLLGVLFSKLLRRPLLLGVWGNPKRIRESTKKPVMPRAFRSIRLEERVERFTLKHADVIAVQNEENGSYPLSLGITPSKLRIFGLGTMVDYCHIIEPHMRALGSDVMELTRENKPIFLCVSRLEKLKLVADLIPIVMAVKRKFQDCLLVVIGEGSLRKSLELQTQNLGLQENIRFVGHKDQEWISQIASVAKLQISPLCGRSLLELGLAGLPSVAYDHDWHSELVQDGITGFLAPVGDTNYVSDKVVRLLCDEETRLIMSHNMRERSLSKVHIETKENIMKKVYKELIVNSQQ